MNEPQEGIRMEDVAAMNPSSKAVQRERGEGITPLPAQGTPINQFEVRGYEVAKLQPDGSWRAIYNLTEGPMSLAKAKADVRWYNTRGSGTYQVRALISAALPTEEPPLVLDADEPGPGDIPQEVIEAMLEEVELEAQDYASFKPTTPCDPEFCSPTCPGSTPTSESASGE